jgi:5-methylcytosine-specific restriction enzyme A
VLDSEFHEGSITHVSVEIRERDGDARKACIAHFGDSCLICGFNFGMFYGFDAEAFIHVHHLNPLSNSTEEIKIDPVKDLIPLCPNCHSVVHLRKDPYSIDEVRKMIEKGKQ